MSILFLNLFPPPNQDFVGDCRKVKITKWWPYTYMYIYVHIHMCASEYFHKIMKGYLYVT